MKLTPMLQQYLRIKAEHRDAILLFRLGDFYEMFFEDAEVAARILDITLTSRNRGDGADTVPLCGIPFHAAEPYVAKLLAAGWKVAICEQREGESRALMEREVVRVVTPGSVLDEASLEPGRSNLLAAIAPGEAEGAGEGRWGLAAVEFSTGAMRATETASWDALMSELERLEVREVILPERLAGEPRALLQRGPWTVSAGVGVTDGGCGAGSWSERWPLAAEAVRIARAYLAYTHRGVLRHLREPEPYELRDHMTLDGAARRNLELTATLSGERRGSLLWVLDRTATPMGARTLREWILAPMLDTARIGGRLDAVEELVEAVQLRSGVAEALRGIGDLERIVGRVGAGTATPRDLAALGAGLARLDAVQTFLAGARSPELVALARAIDPMPQTRRLIDQVLVEEPPAQLRGGAAVIRPGYHPEVDELRDLSRDGRGWIAALETRERERTGIASLKIRYNKVFGYYIEVSRPNLKLVPGDYQRKQTLVGGERFVTAELKEYEGKVLGAEERLRALEAGLFAELVAAVARGGAALAATAVAVGRLDALVSLAEVAHRRGYVRPEVRRASGLRIAQGRHPVVEVLCGGAGGFVPNDCDLDAEEGHILIITGPNMAGKSTYLRQTALIVLMAQMGSFVPAAEARIGIVDRIFTRVGAADNLAAGESTFMVEMRETASILANVTPRSLVILDEIGRGTSTFDGISIAWAVVEHLSRQPRATPLTLFATHYHELTELPRSCPGVRNASVAVREWKGEIVFLRRLVAGPASRSYGIEVARLAGVPDAVVARARAILAGLEAGTWVDGGARRAVRRIPDQEASAQGQLFEAPAARLQRELAAIDIERLTPLEALNYLERLVEVARSGS
jgi:DNA mismatch repair protein MutS